MIFYNYQKVQAYILSKLNIINFDVIFFYLLLSTTKMNINFMRILCSVDDEEKKKNKINFNRTTIKMKTFLQCYNKQTKIKIKYNKTKDNDHVSRPQLGFCLRN